MFQLLQICSSSRLILDTTGGVLFSHVSGLALGTVLVSRSLNFGPDSNSSTTTWWITMKLRAVVCGTQRMNPTVSAAHLTVRGSVRFTFCFLSFLMCACVCVTCLDKSRIKCHEIQFRHFLLHPGFLPSVLSFPALPCSVLLHSIQLYSVLLCSPLLLSVPLYSAAFKVSLYVWSCLEVYNFLA